MQIQHVSFHSFNVIGINDLSYVSILLDYLGIELLKYPYERVDCQRTLPSIGMGMSCQLIATYCMSHEVLVMRRLSTHWTPVDAAHMGVEIWSSHDTWTSD